MERLYANQLDDQASRLALHFSEAGDDAKTVEYGTRAGDMAARLYANEEALRHYTRALEAAKRSGAPTARVVHLYSETGRLLQAMGQYIEALSSYDEMAARARASGDRSLELAALMLRAEAHAAPIPTFNAELAQQQADLALELAHASGDGAAEARILRTLSLLYAHTSRFPQAIDYGERSLAMVRALNAPDRDLSAQIGDALENLMLPYRAAGQREQAEKVSEQARGIWRQLDRKPMLASNLGMAAQFVMGSGDLDRAVAWATEGAALSQLIGNPFNFLFNQRTLMTVPILTLPSGFTEPRMPWPMVRAVTTDEELKAIYMYLHSLTPVEAK